MMGNVKKGLKSFAGWVKGDKQTPAARTSAACDAASFEAQMNEAAGHFEAGRPQRSEEICRYILERDPDHPKALNLLGVISFLKGDKERGVELLNRAIAVQPDFPSAHSNLGKALQGLGQTAKAVQSFRRALMLKPGYPEACSNLAAALSALDQSAEAEIYYRKAIALRPGLVDDHAGLGVALAAQGKLEESVASYRRALALKPDHLVACLNLGALFTLHGRLDEAVEVYRSMLSTTPHAVVHSNLLLCLNYHPDLSSEEIFAEHLQWDRFHGRPAGERAACFNNDRSPERILRIGYVSPDFGLHPIGFFLSSVFPAHDREQFRVFSYSGRTHEDDLTIRLRKNSDVWRVTKGIDDDNLAEMIRADGIDILIDLSGHTRHNRLTVFARKPAPLQMTWAGYVGTTGLSAMDYLISDNMETPEGAERFCRERILRLPRGYLCYEPPGYAPPVAPLPALKNGFVTFGCFNNPAKVTPQVVALWARILDGLPSSRLVLRYKGYEDDEVHGRYLALFAAQGIDAARLELSGSVPHEELLRRYNDIDIALDPFPYSGGLTTMEALWMGVPVVTLEGERFCSRHSLSHLTVVGLPELVGADLDAYLAIAAQLARDTERLDRLRAGLRGKMAASPLCDAAGFTRDLEGAFRESWRRWCQEG